MSLYRGIQVQVNNETTREGKLEFADLPEKPAPPEAGEDPGVTYYAVEGQVASVPLGPGERGIAQTSGQSLWVAVTLYVGRYGSGVPITGTWTIVFANPSLGYPFVHELASFGDDGEYWVPSGDGYQFQEDETHKFLKDHVYVERKADATNYKEFAETFVSSPW